LPSTIETLKVLVSLPLKRPDAFTYGVLERNFINGVLLFGPPGTGKTMLAKAVAKESGARVLEIKGSEVYDMYVGEGEKNVKVKPLLDSVDRQAIFSLARKLSPCVVFIDEVDTIFSSRNASERHVSHREIINQFMAEWDGINSLNSGVLILGATNRPFDLDDAILRRMPRRILVDLPSEDDRLAILKLLLADEQLDPTVDLRSLAKRTNLYSGSDLKNVCVSAAVAAVVERTDLGDSRNDTSVYSKAEKRVLHANHFERALLEVTPSISESMETIELLRKFDKQYGNLRGKKTTAMGFGVKAEEGAANVRALPA
jgi:SpoVK/Ycf46/Vps4 family AAA+-type ATPase